MADQADTGNPLFGGPDDPRHARYAVERAKRLRDDAAEQYVTADTYLADASQETCVDRAPIVRMTDAVIVGGGFGGLQAAAHLRDIGIDDLLILDKAADFGGVWYWNRYPGAQCDVESYIYMPFLEETGYVPTEKYAHAPEIFEHARRIGRHFELYERTLFHTQAVTMTWDEARRRWRVTTDRGDCIDARFLFTASGPLNRPKLPRINGIEGFRGHMFHTSRWDYAYTGGENGGALHGLADKTVAVIGTGATAVQCVPKIAHDAKQLYVVQRTPSIVGERGNAPTDPSWAGSLVPGWQRERMENFNALVSGLAQEQDLVADGWTDFFQNIFVRWRPADIDDLPPEQADRLFQEADLRLGDETRAWIDSQVSDPAVAARLKPWYGMLCKRPTFHDGYLLSFNCPNVTLIDTEGRGLDAISEDAIVSGGVEYPVDCIIFATGFEVGTQTNRSAGADIVGVGGEHLADHFADGPRTFHGFYVHGFPNLFLLGSGNNGVRANFTDMLGEQARHIAQVIRRALASGGTRIEATAEAEENWRKVIVAKSQPIRALLSQCTPGYASGEGDVERSWLANTYGDGAVAFSRLLAEWWEKDDMSGLSVT